MTNVATPQEMRLVHRIRREIEIEWLLAGNEPLKKWDMLDSHQKSAWVVIARWHLKKMNRRAK